MISLVQATQLTRTFLKKLSIACGILLLVFIIFQIGIFIYKVFVPTAPPPAPEGFGLLPQVIFPAQNALISYTINTPTGRLPTFPDRLKVYKIKQRDPQLLDLNNIRKRLNGVGFYKNELKLSEILYQWSNLTEPEIFIRFNIVSNAFEIHSNFYNDPYVLSAKHLPRNAEAQNYVLNFLGAIGENTSNFDLTKTKFEYFRIIDNNLAQVDAVNEAQVIKVNLYQKALDNLNIYYPSYTNEPVTRFWIASSKNVPVVVYANFRHQDTVLKDPLYSSIYLIKTSSQALTDLKNGKAYIFNPQNRTSVEIIDVSMGYYIGERNLSELEQEFIIPIFIFTGRDFKAYVHALADSKFTR